MHRRAGRCAAKRAIELDPEYVDPYPNLAATGVRLPRRRRVPFPEAQRVGALTVFQGDLVVQRPEFVEHAQQEEDPVRRYPSS